MFNNKQDKFILTPVLNILEETRTACCGIGNGIETQSLCEYVMQTTFLKMTGASEQNLNVYAGKWQRMIMHIDITILRKLW